MQAVWRLVPDASRAPVLETELSYFQDHFNGKPLGPGWTPPPVNVRSARRPLADFLHWYLGAPVVSDRGRQALGGLVGDTVEFLPLVELKGRQYFAMNVLQLVDCLDLERSLIMYSSSDSERVLHISSYVFRLDRVREPLFKVPQYPADVFATDPVLKLVQEEGLRGVSFLDPAGRSAGRLSSSSAG